MDLGRLESTAVTRFAHHVSLDVLAAVQLETTKATDVH